MGLHKKRRKRRGYIRPSRAKPKAGWTLAELGAQSGITVRTIRLWLQRGVLPRPRFLGSATRYERRHLVWLLAIRRLRMTEHATLAVIRTRLQAFSEPELEAFATEGPLADQVATALGLASPRTPTDLSNQPDELPGSLAERVGLPRVPRWERIELSLGLELHLRDDASPAVHEFARHIREVGAGSLMPTVAPLATRER